MKKDAKFTKVSNMNIFKTDAIFSDGIIFQQNTENFIEGDGSGEIKLVLTDKNGKTECTSAQSENGRFCVAVPSHSAGNEAYTITLTCGENTVVIKDVLFGDVFHITGQSNMELPMNRTYYPFDGPVPIPKEDKIREFRAPKEVCFDTDKELDHFEDGCWKRACDDVNLEMSAAGYYFAKKMQAELGYPIGLVNTSTGGSPIDGRLPVKVLREFPELDPLIDRVTAPGYRENVEAANEKHECEWADDLKKRDKIGEQVIAGTYHSGKTCKIPLWVNDLTGKTFSGRIWFMREFEVGEDADLDNAMLILGTLVDADESYINGVSVGKTEYLYPPRYYKIPKGVLKMGTNRVAVKLDVKNTNGGWTEGKRFCVMAGSTIIDLAGQWEYEVAVDREPVSTLVFMPGLPLASYAYLTSPAFKLKFKAMVIYQGESNADTPVPEYPSLYGKLFRRFVSYYRERCGYEIPVITTQLPNWDTGDSWALVRQHQLECCDIPNSTMAVTLGMGENNDLHPKNKKAIGDALADCTLRLLYGKGDPAPVTCTECKAEDDGIKLTFSEKVELIVKNSCYFEVKTENGWETADAKADNGAIKLNKNGTAVRYAWLAAADKPELRGESGRLVSPFVKNI